MNLLLRANHSVALFLFALSLRCAIAIGNPIEGNIVKTWAISGQSLNRGAYDGYLQILALPGQSAFTVLRLVRDREVQYHGYQVEELWRGNAIISEDQIFEISFDIRQFGFVTEVEDFKKDLGRTSVLSLKASLDSRASQINLNFNALGIHETLSPATLTQALAPLEESVEMIPSVSQPSPIADLLARLTAKQFYARPFVHQYLENSEFKKGQHSLVRDRVNYAFYQQKPQTLRVINQVLDPASLFEQELRYRAYAYKLREKAATLDQQMGEESLDQFGLISYPLVNESGKVLDHRWELSTALYTGAYVAAQAYRFKVTHEEAALENIRHALHGLMILADISEDPHGFARSLRPSNSSFIDPDPHHEWHDGTGKYAGISYHSRGNNDMMRGIVMGFLFAYEVLPPQDSELKEEMKPLIVRLANSTLAKKRVNNGLMATGAAAIITGDPEMLARYKKLLRSKDNFIDTNFAPPKASGIITDWSGNFLGVSKDIVRSEISHLLGSEEELKDNLKSSFRDWNQLRHFRPAPQSYFLAGELAHFHKQDQIPASLLEDARWALRENLNNKFLPSYKFDHSYSPDFVLSPYPALFWKFIKTKKNAPEKESALGLRAQPLFETLATSQWMWRLSPFAFWGGNDGQFIAPGADYLLPYWMGRFYGLLSEVE